MKHFNHQKNQNGQVLIIAAILVFLISSYTLILLGDLIYSVGVNRNLNNQKTASWLAEAGLEKAIWCLNQTSGENCGGTFGEGYAGETGISFGGGNFTTALSGSASAKDIIAAGVYRGATKTVKASLGREKVTTATYAYAVLAGDAGIDLSSGVTINGNLYSNEDANCVSTTVINGDLTVGGANSVNACHVNGNVKSHNIAGSAISGDAYYQTISSSTVGGTQYPGSPDPPPAAFPISEMTINTWKEDAATGGVWSGDYTVSSDMTLGPIKITGNLTIKNRKSLTLTGTIYVQGDVHIETRAKIILDSGYGANGGIIISDGHLRADGYGEFIGTEEGGHVIFYVLKTEDWAIEVHSGTGRAVFYAPNGGVKVDARSDIIQVSGKKVSIAANASVNYDPRLANATYLSDIEDYGPWSLTVGTRGR